MRTVIIIIIIIGVLVGSYFLMEYLASLKQEPNQRLTEEVIRKVDALTVDYNTIESSILATSRLGSKNYVDVISEVQGEIMKGSVPLKKGQSFRKGDLLIKIFEKETEYNLKAAKSRFLNGIANVLPDFKIDFPASYPKIKKFFDADKSPVYIAIIEKER